MAFDPRSSDGSIVSVDLWGEAPVFTAVNKLPMPAGATVTWTSKRQEKLTLRSLDSGMSRDVYMSPEAPYVLKLQAEWSHEYTNGREAMLGVSSFAKLAPRIYGSICTLYRGVPVSVLVAERVPHTYLSWCRKLVQAPPDATSLKILVDVVAGFSGSCCRGLGTWGTNSTTCTGRTWASQSSRRRPRRRARPAPPGSTLESAHASRLCYRGASGREASVCVDGGSRCD